MSSDDTTINFSFENDHQMMQVMLAAHVEDISVNRFVEKAVYSKAFKVLSDHTDEVEAENEALREEVEYLKEEVSRMEPEIQSLRVANEDLKKLLEESGFIKQIKKALKRHGKD